MENLEGPLANATPPTSWHQLHWWKSPRWTVIRIETLTVVAIIFSLFLAAFGSCRRWSNRWIVQKGFFAAQVLSLSLGTYSIGLMQSSSVKSEMYPIWTVSLFTLFSCIDPVTTYNGLDYKGPLSKVVYGICLNCGYVLLMSISSISNVVGSAAIITLSVISFIKGFHRSFALVQQNRMRDMVYALENSNGVVEHLIRKDEPQSLHDMTHMITVDLETTISQFNMKASIRNNKDKRLRSCYDMCVALCLSHRLQQHILGLDYHVPCPITLKGIDYEWTLKVIEIELALVYDALFTGNPFLHYYQAKTASLWALASFIGICFVLVATSIPGGMTRHYGASGCTKVVDTTNVDLAITFGILVSLALLQLTQLVRSWTSNWARAAVAWAYAREKAEELRRVPLGHSRRTCKLSGWMRLKVLVATSTNIFDKYLWQDKISQYSLLPEPRLLTGRKRGDSDFRPDSARKTAQSHWGRLSASLVKKGDGNYSSKTKGERISLVKTKGEPKQGRCVYLVQMLGLHYVWQVIWELLSSDSNKRGGVKLDEDVKGFVIDFLGQIQSDTVDRNWLSSLPEEPAVRHFLPHFSDPRLSANPEVLCYRYTSCVLTWHIATWYCELAEHKRQEDALMSKQAEVGRETASSYLRKAAAAIPRPGIFFQKRAAAGGGGGGGTKTRDHRRVANAVSQYCVYLVKSAPELLPGPVSRTKRVYDRFAEVVKLRTEGCDKDTILANMSDLVMCLDWNHIDSESTLGWRVQNGEALAKLLMRRPDEIWKTLALVWVQLLVYAAPYGNAEAHMRHLSQGGEFITHLWALLYHLDIREWKFQVNLVEITTEEDAKRILAEESQAIVAYLWPRQEYFGQQTVHDELASASRLEDGVRYYYTLNDNIAKHFGFSYYGRPRVVWLKQEADNHKFTFYGGNFRAYDIARFVTENIVALPHDQPQAQSSEDNGGQSEARIEEEIQPHP